mmetsp:Transcript_22019/g.47867  ORF Transcript_22019/g.47867 Transcript_22019/m.47867 type:complete len:269 (-) Transcript_22019:158-964(-)|eukprot:CAMPEP_0172301600 /NCGR_PEP_ID=MMETSP1058-20130122/3448_1 /TAXON_ID=83371 /ORGANISM="Detonula confervacea, Strain CCMP 353" /LENGTH=268 /DNA_ID=CAMNT_0013011771 /DNA_START=321 /DNA_END=1127 /DNA_ORIENTATION=+
MSKNNISSEATTSGMSDAFASDFGIGGNPNKNLNNKKHTIMLEIVRPTSNKKLKPNVAGLKSTPPAPIGKRTYNTFVNILNCKEVSVFLIDLNKPDGDQAYEAPYKAMLNTQPYVALDEYHIIGMAARRNSSYPDKDLPLPQGRDSMYGRYCLVCFRDGDETVEEFGNSLAAKLTNYANSSEAFIGSKNHFIYHQDNNQTTASAQPVNYYLRTKDTLLLLKKVYGSEGITKTEIIEDYDVLDKFFGEVQKGIDLLKPLSEDQWQHLEF